MNKNIKKLKQVAAMAAVAIILILYAITLVLSIMNNSYTEKFFTASLFSTFFIPLMLYLLIWIRNLFVKKESDEKSDSQKFPK